MPLAYRFLFPGLWVSWCLYWLWASRRAKLSARRESPGSLLLHMVPLILAAELLASNRTPIVFLNERLYPWAPWQFWMAALVTALGLLFTVWARTAAEGEERLIR